MKSSWKSFVSRIAALAGRRRLEAEMAEEMRLHIEELTRANVAAGMDGEEARHEALRQFGGIAQIEERCRDEHGFVWMGQVARDFRFTVRSLLRSRGFTLTVLFTFVLGIGVSTAVFNLTAATTLFDLPFPDPGSLYRIGYTDPRNDAVYYTPRFQFLAYQEQLLAGPGRDGVFTEFAAAGPRTANVTVGSEPLGTWVYETSPDFFRTLGISPAFGRAFLPGEFKAGSNDVVVISDLVWRKYFGSSPDVLGRQISIDRRPCTIVGVLAANQRFPSGMGGTIYRPLVYSEDPNNLFRMFTAIGRLKPGIPKEQATAALATVRLPAIPQWASDYISHQRPVLGRLTEVERSKSDWVILAAAAFLFAIACLNAMNLMLIRLLGRRRELSIRFAVGGSRLQVVRLLMLESIALAGTASLMVAILAKWVFPPLFSALDGDDSALFHNYWDWGTLSCIAALSLVACLAASAVPTFRLLAADINPGLKDGGPAVGESRGAGRVRNALVVLQSAFAVVLLIGAGLMVRSFERLHHLDLGFDPNGKVKVRVSPPSDFDLKPEARVQLFEALQRRLGAIPGVRSASFSQDSLFIGFFSGTAELRMADGRYEPVAGNFVSADYQRTAGLVLKSGRWLSGRKGEDEAVVSESMARELFGSADPIGRTFKIKVSGDFAYPIVGVVKDVRDIVRAPAGIRFYVPYWMYPSNIDSLVLRLDKDPEKGFEGVVRRAVNEVEPRLIVTEVSSINEIVGNSMATERYALTILKGLSSIAFGLTVVGLFSVIAYSVSTRLNEFGVRIALGATSADLKRMVIARGLGAASLGLALGGCGAAGLTRFMRSLLFETKPFDPSVYLGVGGILVLASVAACWMPARRASRVDVVRLLRSD